MHTYFALPWHSAAFRTSAYPHGGKVIGVLRTWGLLWVMCFMAQPDSDAVESEVLTVSQEVGA